MFSGTSMSVVVIIQIAKQNLSKTLYRPPSSAGIELKSATGPVEVTAAGISCQPKRNKRISRSAAARRNESMPRQSLKPRHYAAASHISPRNFASVRQGMPRSAT
ncbi:hypothetical protein DPMN_079032 [Dreissena polymorpha]|uniref:Uncharacterized protein n=1 Tax=Dreissena polymorpha TaxID=45954 RepID=A0A9D3YNB9_DREPO|nr:hypothetical protein DPMN_079032 [Dreissena polymorpha]